MKNFGMFALGVVCAANVYAAEIRLPALISDHAMFQANRPIAIWGWGDAGKSVTVDLVLNGRSSSPVVAVADTNGKWSIHLPPQPDGLTGELRVGEDGKVSKTVHDVLVGEVWLGSGQSNMEYDIAGTGRVEKNRPDEVAEVKQNLLRAQQEAQEARPPIRFFQVAHRHSEKPLDDVEGHWILVSPIDTAHCSAVAWNFAVNLQARLHVPVGMIVSSVGNTPIETWMSRETLLSTHVGEAVIERNRVELSETTPERLKEYQATLDHWKAANPTPQLQTKNSGSRPAAPANLSARNYVPNQYFNGMIAGLQPYTIRGIVWYQGAGNMFHPEEYGEMFVAMIREWRSEWQDPQLPFLFVEESNFGPKQMDPVEPNGISIIREQQHVALKLPATQMAVSMDLGNGNPHYPNKRAIALRLVELALVQCYHTSGNNSSPMVVSFKVKGNRIRLELVNADGLQLSSKSDRQGFALRGKDGKWQWATGKIEGKSILVWSAEVTKPVAVRYAWAQNPITSVVNGKGLPLSSFRSDKDKAN